MKKMLGILIIVMVFVSNGFSQNIEVVDYDGLSDYLNKKNDTTYVINFWATWCIPCVKELPDFNNINEVYKNRKFKMLLVSLDFKSQIESSLLPFISKNNIQPEVILLSDPNSNEWINKVNKKWTGSLPATIIYNQDLYFFHEGSMKYDELNEQILNNIKL